MNDIQKVTDGAIEALNSKEIELKELETVKQSLAVRIAEYKHAIETIRNGIKNTMLSHNLKSIVHKDYKLTLKNVAPSVEISDESLLPEQYFKIKKEVNKALIKAVLGTGSKIDGAQLSEPGVSLLITKVKNA